MIIDCIGCLHGACPRLKGGDLLIITGDLTASHRVNEIFEFFHWLSKQKYKKKIIVAGNHDNMFEGISSEDLRLFYTLPQNIEYLCDSGTEYEGLKIWGSPWTAAFKGINPRCTTFTIPFNSDTEDRLMEKWEMIPDDIDILITHGPAFGVLDGIPVEDGSLFHVGSKSLYEYLQHVGRSKAHIFSHIHEGYGQDKHFPIHDGKMISVNCSIMDRKYQPVNKPIRIVL